jgi:hypothetical protein
MPAIISVIIRLAIYALSALGGAAITSVTARLLRRRAERAAKKKRTVADENRNR